MYFISLNCNFISFIYLFIYFTAFDLIITIRLFSQYVCIYYILWIYILPLWNYISQLLFIYLFIYLLSLFLIFIPENWNFFLVFIIINYLKIICFILTIILF